MSYVWSSTTTTTFCGCSLEEEFPDEGSLQGFRFQIAQSYWSVDDQSEHWLQTIEWLDCIIDTAKGADTFYSDLAKRYFVNMANRWGDMKSKRNSPLH